MAQELTVFGDSEGFYPGRVCRAGPPVDWAAVLDASCQKARSSAAVKPSVLNMSGVNSSHSSAASMVVQDASESVQSSSEDPDERKKSFVESNKAKSQRHGSNPLTTTPVVTTEEKLIALLAEPVMNLEAVKKLSWAGLPNSVRAPVWKVLLGYLPTNSARRKDTLERRRREYREAVEQHYVPSTDSPEETKSWQSAHAYNRVGHQEDVTMRQISVDLPRTCPGQAMFHISEVQFALQRILYVWATRHPASGYVQGMNDLVTPFMFVFLAEYAKSGTEHSILDITDLSALERPEEALANAEADAYWCLTALLNDIQDYYTFSQPGIQRRVHYLRELVARVDSSLCTHLEDEGLDFLQFAFRWMNCLLMRELPFPLIVRVWDTYLAESEGFALFHVYVCAALLVSFSEELQDMDFQDLVMFLQNLPTESWASKEIDVILSQAYMWRTIFGAAPSHLQ